MAFSSRLQIAVLLLTIGFLWTQINGQYETPNNWCGGYFRYIEGNIRFIFNSSTTNITDTEKMCMWTVAPTRQYLKFNITAMTLPDLPCEAYSVTINTLGDRSQSAPLSTRYCKGSMPTQFPFTLSGSVMVIILKVRNVGEILIHQGSGFYISYSRNSEADWNNSTQLINTFYSFGKPSVDPNPYFAAGFINNGMSTFGFLKANYSTGSNYEFQLSYDTIKIDSNQGCAPPNDFLMMCEISPTGALVQPTIFSTNRTSTEVFKNGFGYFIIWWGGRGCGIGGGGSMQLYYTSVRIA